MAGEPIKAKKNKQEDKPGLPLFEEKPELGDEEQAAEITETNQELDRQLGFDPADGDPESSIGPDHSVDERMPVGSESPEDKAQDIINSGVIWS